VKRLHNMKEGIDRQRIHTFWRNFVSKLRKKQRKGGGVVVVSIHASGACGCGTWRLASSIETVFINRDSGVAAGVAHISAKHRSKFAVLSPVISGDSRQILIAEKMLRRL
jgi:hypothetical protein